MPIKLFFILFCLFSVGFSIPNELNPIPAFLIQNDDEAALFIEMAYQYKFTPITYEDYQRGKILAPKNYTPYILVFPRGDISYNIVENTNNLNLPSFHMNFDPVNNIKVAHISLNKFPDWYHNSKKFKLFRSDGDYTKVSYKKLNKNDLFVYAPFKNMTKNEFFFWFFSKKNPYLTKMSKQKNKRIPLQGLHLTKKALDSSEKINLLINQIKNSPLDSVIIDLKSYLNPSILKHKNFTAFIEEDNQTLLKQNQELLNTIKTLKKNNIKVSLRLVVAIDTFITKTNKNALLQNKKTNKPWKDWRGQMWVDIFSPDSLTYYKKIINLAMLFAPDNIQLDYIRFPTEGPTDLIYSKYSGGAKNYKAIDNFLKQATKICDKNKVSLSVDIFGIVVWQNKRTVDKLGQNILAIMRYADEICPMLYPSHFHSEFEGVENPGAEPYLFMNKGCKKFKAIVEKFPQYSIKMVPWIQAFNYKSPGYSPNYIKEQIKAVEDTAMHGYLAWNGRNVYPELFQALTK